MSKKGITPPPGGYAKAIRRLRRENREALETSRARRTRGPTLVDKGMSRVKPSEQALAELAAGALHHGHVSLAQMAARAWAWSANRRQELLASCRPSDLARVARMKK